MLASSSFAVAAPELGVPEVLGVHPRPSPRVIGGSRRRPPSVDLRLPARNAAQDAVLRELDERRHAHRDLARGKIGLLRLVAWANMGRLDQAEQLRPALERADLGATARHEAAASTADPKSKRHQWIFGDFSPRFGVLANSTRAATRIATSKARAPGRIAPYIHELPAGRASAGRPALPPIPRCSELYGPLSIPPSLRFRSDARLLVPVIPSRRVPPSRSRRHEFAPIGRPSGRPDPRLRMPCAAW